MFFFYLWGHVVGRAHSALAVVLFRNHPGEAEIGELQLGKSQRSILIINCFVDSNEHFLYLCVVLGTHEEDVLRLEVAVDDVLGVEEAEGDEDLDGVVAGQRLAQPTLGLDTVEEVTCDQK